MLPDQWELVVLRPVVVAAAWVYFDQPEHCYLQDLEPELGFELQVLELDFELQVLEIDLWDLVLCPQIDLEHWD